MSPHAKPAWTLDEFLAWERLQDLRFEFDGVQPVAITGGTLRHSAIASRVEIALDARLRRPCRVFRGDVKVITTGDQARYPDVVVSCAAVLPPRADILPDPVVVFEVLSPSTAAIDSTIKAHEYRATDSIHVIVLLDPEMDEATVFRRATGWRSEVIPAGGRLRLGEIGIEEVPLADLFPDF